MSWSSSRWRGKLSPFVESNQKSGDSSCVAGTIESSFMVVIGSRLVLSVMSKRALGFGNVCWIMG